VKEIIRRIYFVLVWLGLADAEVVAVAGTIKHRFLTWMYGESDYPLFETQWPDDGK